MLLAAVVLSCIHKSDHNVREGAAMPWNKEMPANPVVAVAGATGVVGREMLKVLEQRDFPASKVKALASARSAGTTVPFKGAELTVEEMTPKSFEGVDIALFSAGAGVSRQFRQAVVDAGCVMIDNSSAFRQEKDVPLVVPEVNAHDLAWHSGVIANPNCSTIEMVVPLKALADAAGGIKRIVVSTYQAASGAGMKAMNELYNQTKQFLADEPLTIEAFSDQIAFSVIPHIDVPVEDDYYKEEWKMVVETKKIFGDDSIEVAPTCVRVPVLRCHAESVNVELPTGRFSPDEGQGSPGGHGGRHARGRLCELRLPYARPQAGHRRRVRRPRANRPHRRETASRCGSSWTRSARAPRSTPCRLQSACCHRNKPSSSQITHVPKGRVPCRVDEGRLLCHGEAKKAIGKYFRCGYNVATQAAMRVKIFEVQWEYSNPSGPKSSARWVRPPTANSRSGT